MENEYGIGVYFKSKEDWERFVKLYNEIKPEDMDELIAYDELDNVDLTDKGNYPVKITFASFTKSDVENGNIQLSHDIEDFKRVIKLFDAGYEITMYKI